MAGFSIGKKRSAPALAQFVEDLTGIPRYLLLGWFAGALVPVAALMGIMGGVYFLTRKLPFVSGVEEEGDRRRLVIELVEPDEARDLLRRSGEAVRAFGDEVRSELEGETELSS
jgi:hypothetical protein